MSKAEDPGVLVPGPDDARLRAVLAQLDAMHRWRGSVWQPGADPFEIIVGAILVQNTAWTNVERALDQLRAAGVLRLEAMNVLPAEELEALIRPSGQYRQKARKLRAFLDLAGAHGGLRELLALPKDELRTALLGTWGIGPETADCIVLYASKQPSFVVDAYTKRVFSRLGLGPGEDAAYGSWKHFFEAALPSDAEAWAAYHALLVLHAKHLCRKRAPLCGGCSLRGVCPGAFGR